PQDPLLKRLLALLQAMELLKRQPEFDSVPRYLRKYVPRADFASTNLDYADETGELFRQRGLAMNRKARDALKAKHVISDENCVPVLIVNRPPKGVENLDRLYGAADPTFSPAQLAQIRAREA